MKLFLLLSFLFSLAAQANPWPVIQDTSSVSLAATFAGSGQLTGPNKIISVDVVNTTATDIEVNCSEGTTPSSNAADSFPVPAGYTISSPPNIQLGTKCWWRSYSGTISSGKIYVVAWGY